MGRMIERMMERMMEKVLHRAWVVFLAFVLSAVLTVPLRAQGDGASETEEEVVYDEGTEVGDAAATEGEVLQDEPSAEDTAVAAAAAAEEDMTEPEQSFHQIVKEQFIAGDWRYMSLVLACLILGLAIALERIITLNLATVDTKALLKRIEGAVRAGDVGKAKSICKATRGPVASIFTQGFLRIGESIDSIEKSIVSYGSVEMGKLEKGMVWVSLFISLAPMLGFLGTVIGMVNAFDAIAAAGDVSPSLVADGIKIALITTVGGLIVAIILQLFYNYLVAKIDSIVNEMEDASISLVDILVRYKKKA